ncbi:hypothetical protein D5301_08215 [Stenotrophomonas sp. MH181796]|nr:hypothetical protein [Stenotrophomonas sp. MH181796]
MLTLENRANVRVDRGFKRAKELQVQFGSTVAYQRVLESRGFSSLEHNIHYAKSRIRRIWAFVGSAWQWLGLW